MLHLLDMASSPEYLTTGSIKPEYLDADMNIDPEILSDSSCAHIAPSTMDYSTSDHTNYSEVSHISPFDTSPALNDALSTPASSASSPNLHGRKPSLLDHPSPPLTAATTMYPYPEFMTGTNGGSPVPTGHETTEAPQHDQLLAYLHHNNHSPGHHSPPPPPPQANPYFGAYGVSVPPEGPNTTDHHQQQHFTYLQQDTASNSYTHTPLAPHMLHQQSYRREDAFNVSLLPRLQAHAAPPPAAGPASTGARRHQPPPPVHARRDPARKVRARRGTAGNAARRGSWSPPPPLSQQQPQQFRFGGEEGLLTQHEEGQQQQQQQQHGDGDDGSPDEEVTLDEDTPADLRRLWEMRRKYSARKGNGMWEDIMVEYLGQEDMAETKKTQAKAALQMKIHRVMLKHGQWPNRDRTALLRAYKRWEENRYNEILRYFEEEMGGRRKAFEWKSQHVEAQLVRLGLEEPERDRDSRARKRTKQVAARHQNRATGSGPQSARSRNVFPGATAPLPYQHYSGFGGGPYEDVATLEQQLGVSSQPPALTEEQRERLIDECLEREPFQVEDEGPGPVVPKGDMRMADYEHAKPRSSSLMLPGLHLQQHDHHQQQHIRQRSPSIPTKRNTAVSTYM